MIDPSDPNFLEDLAREVRAVSDRLNDLEESGLLAQLGMGSPARSGFDLGALAPVMGAGQILPTSVIADAAVTTDSIATGAVTTETLNASAVIKLVTNAGATVVINAAGISVTGGAISVINPGGTVIIDGTSDMFKIAATGTQSTTQASGAGRSTNSTTLTALSPQSTSLALVGMVGANNAASDLRGPVYFNGLMPPTEIISQDSGLTGSPVVDPFVRIILDNNTGGSKTAYQRYYLLLETAI